MQSANTIAKSIQTSFAMPVKNIFLRHRKILRIHYKLHIVYILKLLRRILTNHGRQMFCATCRTSLTMWMTGAKYVYIFIIFCFTIYPQQLKLFYFILVATYHLMFLQFGDSRCVTKLTAIFA